MSSLRPEVLQQIFQEWKTAPHGSKTEILRRWSRVIGLSVQQLHRVLPKSEKRKRKAEPIRKEYWQWAEVVFAIKKRPPEGAGEIITEQAVRIAVQEGKIPEEALQVPVGTFDRIGRQLMMHRRRKRANRIQAERPNQVHHFDASTSKFFYVAREVGNDYVLKLHRPGQMGYKNKPIPVDRKRPWVYGVTDDHSGYHLALYTVAVGETAADSLLALSMFWEEMGLPEELMADQGMLKKCLASAEFIERLGIRLPQAMPYEKQAHGKIERPWRTHWHRFERQFFALSDWERFEITLEELNRQFRNYLEEYNSMPHRFEKDISRRDAWRRVNLYGGIVKIPRDALQTVARRAKRKVDAAGILHYEGHDYEVKGLHDAWVYVYEGVFEDRLVVQDVETGQRYEVQKFRPLAWGEFRAHKKTPHERAVQMGEALEIKGVLYTEAPEKDGRVVEMPIRTKEEREVTDPFDVDRFATLDDAWQEFASIVGGLIPEEEKAVILRLFREHDLEMSFVIDLAQEVRAAKERRRATG